VFQGASASVHALTDRGEFARRMQPSEKRPNWRPPTSLASRHKLLPAGTAIKPNNHSSLAKHSALFSRKPSRLDNLLAAAKECHRWPHPSCAERDNCCAPGAGKCSAERDMTGGKEPQVPMCPPTFVAWQKAEKPHACVSLVPQGYVPKLLPKPLDWSAPPYVGGINHPLKPPSGGT